MSRSAFVLFCFHFEAQKERPLQHLGLIKAVCSLCLDTPAEIILILNLTPFQGKAH